MKKKILLFFYVFACAILWGQNTATVNWQLLSGSEELQGSNYGYNRPLQYNADLNLVSFTHLKKQSYITSPANSKGDVIIVCSSNNGQTWDTTCVWSNSVNLAMYPQGVVYNPPLNTSIANSYIVTSGITTNSNVITGNFYASKALNVYNPNASSQPNAQQFFPNTAPYNSTKHDNACNTIISTDDGIIRIMAVLADSINSKNFAGFGLRGAYLSQGNFLAGSFIWQGDSLIPSTITRIDGSKQLSSIPMVAFNKNGNVGYIVMIGSKPSLTIQNTGWQPIVYKTTNYGVTWNLVNGIDFSNPFFAPILNRLSTTINNTTAVIPQFNINEGIGITVDKNNNLHLAALLNSTKSSDHNLLDTPKQFGIDGYKWPHSPGKQPYLYDFLTDGNTWNYMLVDSLMTEAPGTKPLDSGFNHNPWMADVNNIKLPSNSRIQLSRSDNGRFVIYSYAESDTNFTNYSKKWNSLPNVKVKIYDAVTNGLASGKINITKTTPPSLPNPNVSSRAHFYNISPVSPDANGSLGYSIGAGCIMGGSVSINIHATVTNTIFPGDSPKHWYSYVKLSMNNVAISNHFPILDVGIKTKGLISYPLNLFPNPANDYLQIQIEDPKTRFEKAFVYNNLGQLINEYDLAFENNISVIDTRNLPNGFYFLSFKNNSITTKRFVIAR